MKVSFSGLAVTGITATLPKNKMDLAALGKKFGENEVKRIMASTGIKRVGIADEEVNASDLCLVAANNLLKKMNVAANTLDAIIFISQTPDAIMPATSVMLQDRLGMSTRAVAFDISYGCSGYIYGLYQAAMLISSGGCNKVLLCAGDVISPLLHPLDKHVRMVFGDAGSATVIERGDDEVAFTFKTDGSGSQHLRTAKITNQQTYLHMDGSAVMEFALREVPAIVQELLSMKKWQNDEVGTYAFHQANFFMLNYLRKKMQLTKEAVPIAVENNGNTGSASIPLTLSLTHNGLRHEDRLNKVVMCGFGVGLSLGAVGLNLSKTIILPPTDYEAFITN